MLQRLRTIAVIGAIMLTVVLIGGTAYVVWAVRRPFPATEGALPAAGLTSAVRVVRDKWGVPHVYADNALDLFRAQGYIHAQDRFWEMDVRRHIASGRLAELFGAEQVETDAFIRTLGWRRVAERELALLSPATRRYLEAYAEGVNAYLATRQGPELGLEYAVLDVAHPEYHADPWSPVDSLVWLKVMAWDLRTNVKEELARALAAAGLPQERVEELYPPYPFERHQPIVRRGGVVEGQFRAGAEPAPVPEGARSRLAQLSRLIEDIPPLLGDAGSGVGSNSWVVSGKRTRSGRPILANDPHLAPSIPGIWYQMGLHCTQVDEDCPFDVAGVTLSGVPGVIIGHNAKIAWGFTNLRADVADLYLEDVDRDTYRYRGRSVPLELRRETIEVAGDEPVRITVRATRHGPLISDVGERFEQAGQSAPVVGGGGSGQDGGQDRGQDRGYAVALRWTALHPGRTADAIFGLNQASDWRSFRAAARRFAVPAQNLLYADVKGNIGYQAPGRIPIRESGDGRWPVPGWTGDYEWQGRIPFAALPHVTNPPSGYLVTANNAVIGPSYPYLLTGDWAYGYRSQRIAHLIEDAGRLDVAAVQRMQVDTRNPVAPALVPHLLRVEPDEEFVRSAQDLLRDWNFRQPQDSAAALYFNAVWRQLLALTFHDELPDTAWPSGDGRWFEVVRGLLRQPDARWWDDIDTESRESRDDILRAALRAARYELTADAGKHPREWEWGRLHDLELVHQTLGRSGVGPVEALFNRGTLQLGGGEAIVNATGWDASRGYGVRWVPSMRMIVNLADLDTSRWVNLTGQSGHAYADHYWDQAELWRDGKTAPFAFTPAAVRRLAEHTLVLRPDNRTTASTR